MKRLAIVAAVAILLLGAIAVAAVLLAGRDDLPALPAGGPGAPAAPSGPGALPPPIPVPPVEGPTGATGYPPGPRKVRLNPGRVKRALIDPLEHCFRQFPTPANLPAVLTLDLEAQSSGGFAVVGVRVKTWGDANRGLVECAAQTLVGQVVPGGSFTAGDVATYELSLDPPASIMPPMPEPPSSGLPASRQPPPRRGSR